MPEGAILEPPTAEEVDGEVQEQEGPQEVPSIFSVTNRHIVGRVEVTPPAEDGSRILRLFSANGGTVIEANLSPELSEFVSNKLVEVEVIEEVDAEVVEDDAGSKE